MTTGLALLREPFPAHQISKLPKPTKAQTDEVKANFKAGIRCEVCGSWHHPKVVHLDYVGHAALTDRLLNADPNWTWEPLSMADGLPTFDGFGGMWIRLTVCGVTRLGYGHSGDKNGGDAVKETIGDALRNAAMRFGAALDLWHKGELHKESPGSDKDTGSPEGDNLEQQLKDSIEQVKQKKAGVMGAVLPAVEAYLDVKVRVAINKVAEEVTKLHKQGAFTSMFSYYEDQGLTNEEKTYFWSLLESNVRAKLKREIEESTMRAAVERNKETT